MRRGRGTFVFVAAVGLVGPVLAVGVSVTQGPRQQAAAAVAQELVSGAAP